MKSIPFLLERLDDRNIHGWWHLPEGETKGTVLFLHGYKGYMDWGCWHMVGNVLATQGWRMLRVNFTHNGTTPENPSNFEDLAAFAANTYRRERDEATAVLRALRTPTNAEDPIATDGPLAVIGHSRGGGIACLAAQSADQILRQEGMRGVDAVIAWAAVADFAARFPNGSELEAWRSSGRRDVINHRTRQRLHHNWSFYQDFKDFEEELTIKKAVQSFQGRVMAAHGTGDSAVPPEHAHQIAKWARNPTLFIMDDAGHTFGASEPWEQPELPQELDALTQTTLHFLEEGRAVQ